jgi:mono/diheme cytochrome c family protein
MKICSLLRFTSTIAWGLFALLAVFPAQAQGDARSGEYLAKAAGCVGCHTETKAGAVPFAGGRALETPFGTFFGPNITPDRQTGIGNWGEGDFKRALRFGERPDGAHYFPSFPYPSFTGMSDKDIQDLWAYFRALPPTNQANRDHVLKFPYNLRFLVGGWKMMFFKPGPVQTAAPAADPVTRGAYLVNVLGHCGECHTPRNFLGGPDNKALLAGAVMPNGKVPNLTPTRLKRWSDADLTDYLKTGTAPNGDVVVDPMSEVITNTTSQLTPQDLAAMVAYLRTVPAHDEPAKK